MPLILLWIKLPRCFGSTSLRRFQVELAWPGKYDIQDSCECVIMFFMASIWFKTWTWTYINVLMQRLRLITYIFSFFHQEEVIWLPLFWLRLLLWYLMCVNKGEFSLELFNHEIMMPLPLSTPLKDQKIWEKDCIWSKDILLWGKCQL